MSPFLGELIGTMILIILGNGVNAGVTLKNSNSENSGWIVITFGWALAVTMGVFAVGNISGAHLNPAVTLGLAASGAFEWTQVLSYISAQMIGAFLGATIVWIFYLPHWRITPNPADKLGVFATGPAVRAPWSNMVSEIIGTLILVMGLLFIGANKFTDGLNPLVVGGLILVIGISLGGTTGYAINPARDLSPRLAHFLLPIKGKGDSNWSYAHIPVIGPLVGGVAGAMLYQWLFMQETSIVTWVALGTVLIIIGLAIREEHNKQ